MDDLRIAPTEYNITSVVGAAIGRPFDVEVTFVSFRDVEGAVPYGVIGVVRDVSLKFS